MSPGFFAALISSAEVIGKLYLIAAAGYFLVKRRIIGEHGIQALTRLIVDLIVPCSLAMGMIKGFDRGGLTTISPVLLMVTIAVVAAVIATLILFHFFPSRNRSVDRIAVSLASMPNSIYIPLPILMAMTPAKDQPIVAMLVGAAVFAINPMQWTIGLWLILGDQRQNGNWRATLKAVINPPVTGVVVGTILSQIPMVVTAAKGDPSANALLRMILGSVATIGQAMGPMAMIMIGSLIASTSIRRAFSLYHFLVVCGFRFLVIPGLLLWTIASGWIPGGKLVWLVLMVEGASPSAMNLAIAARRFGGDWETTSGMLFAINVVAIFTLPLWIAATLSLP